MPRQKLLKYANSYYESALELIKNGDRVRAREMLFEAIYALQHVMALDSTEADMKRHEINSWNILDLIKKLRVEGITTEMLISLDLNSSEEKKKSEQAESLKNQHEKPSESTINKEDAVSEEDQAEIARRIMDLTRLIDDKERTVESQKQDADKVENKEESPAVGTENNGDNTHASVDKIDEIEERIAAMQDKLAESSTKEKEHISGQAMRPTTLEYYIGQKDTIAILRDAITAAQKRKKVLGHILFYGAKGLGKTTLANIIASEMGGKMIECPPAIFEKKKDIIKVLSSIKEGDVIFIDEIHGLPRAFSEVFYSAMEDLKYTDYACKGDTEKLETFNIPPFTLIAGTTHSGHLPAALLNKFIYQFRLVRYTEDELAEICKNALVSLGKTITHENAKMIAECSCGTPRNLIHLIKQIDDLAVVSDSTEIDKDMIERALERMKIGKNGLKGIQNEILNIIYDTYNGGPVSASVLAMTIGEEQINLENEYEPELIMQGFVKITRKGRCITDLGCQYIGKEALNKNIDSQSGKSAKKSEAASGDQDEVEVITDYEIMSEEEYREMQKQNVRAVLEELLAAKNSGDIPIEEYEKKKIMLENMKLLEGVKND